MNEQEHPANDWILSDDAHHILMRKINKYRVSLMERLPQEALRVWSILDEERKKAFGLAVE